MTRHSTRLAPRLFVLCALVGVIAGSGALVFDGLTQIGQRLFLDGMAGYRPDGPAGEAERFEPSQRPLRPLMLILVPALGGLLAGIVVFRFAPEAKGHGTDGAIDAYHNRQGHIRPRVPLIKMIASTLTLGSGGSGGREGPIAQIGAGFGSWMATRLKLGDRERRILLAAGMGAGVGAIFRAPLAGALFAAEILYSDSEFESTVVIPAAISSIVGYCVYTLSVGTNPLFETPAFAFRSPLELLAYAFLALVLALVGRFYVWSFYGIEGLFERLRLPSFLKPALGGLLAGGLAVGIFEAMGGNVKVLNVLGLGYGILQEVLMAPAEESLKAGLVLILIVIALGKILTTGLSISSGGSAGVFGPSMVIGGTLGGAVGLLLHSLWPEVVTSPGAFVLVGMAGFFAGVAKTPISTIVMVSEMTGSYLLLVPSMWVSTITFLLCRRHSIYRSQVPSKINSPAHQGDFSTAQLAGYTVSDFISHDRSYVTFEESDPLEKILDAVAQTRQEFFPVLARDGTYVGGLTIREVRLILESGRDLAGLVVAADLMETGLPTIHPDDAAVIALERLAGTDLNEIVVLSEDEPARFVGLLAQRDVLLTVHPRERDAA